MMVLKITLTLHEIGRVALVMNDFYVFVDIVQHGLTNFALVI